MSDRVAYVAIGILGFIATIVIVGYFLVIALTDDEIPGEIFAVAAAAVGAIGGILVPSPMREDQR